MGIPARRAGGGPRCRSPCPRWWPATSTRTVTPSSTPPATRGIERWRRDAGRRLASGTARAAPPPLRRRSLAIADTDGDGSLELIAGSADGWVDCRHISAGPRDRRRSPRRNRRNRRLVGRAARCRGRAVRRRCARRRCSGDLAARTGTVTRISACVCRAAIRPATSAARTFRVSAPASRFGPRRAGPRFDTTRARVRSRPEPAADVDRTGRRAACRLRGHHLVGRRVADRDRARRGTPASHRRNAAPALELSSVVRLGRRAVPFRHRCARRRRHRLLRASRRLFGAAPARGRAAARRRGCVKRRRCTDSSSPSRWRRSPISIARPWSRYDLPPGWRMALDERKAVIGAAPTGAPLFYREERLVTHAVNDAGDDVTAKLLGGRPCRDWARRRSIRNSSASRVRTRSR